MKTFSISLSQSQIDDLRQRHGRAQIRTDIAHTQFQIKGSDYTITVYTSKKVVFQGEDIDWLIAGYQNTETEPEPAVEISLPMAGSDEVGTGDYFGPITVCACVVTKTDANTLPLDLILDSKKMQDDTIRALAPKLMATLTHSMLVLDNRTYNRIQKEQNLNQIKAKLHNQAYLHLAQKTTLPALAIVDQFTPERLYFRYLKGEKIYRKLHFETKAESKYIAVACASVIARYAFLEAMDQMGEHYGVVFPKGAGRHVDDFALEFVKDHGFDTLINVAKVHFKNTERISDALAQPKSSD